ncbi:MAG: hypothetical protein R3C68_01695 [Myxococcota bacterium]
MGAEDDPFYKILENRSVHGKTAATPLVAPEVGSRSTARPSKQQPKHRYPTTTRTPQRFDIRGDTNAGHRISVGVADHHASTHRGAVHRG